MAYLAKACRSGQADEAHSIRRRQEHPVLQRELRHGWGSSAVPVAVARELAVGLEEAFEHDWHAPGRMERALAALASASVPYLGTYARPELFLDPDAFREATESVLRRIADGPGGVVLGRAGMVVLANRPDVLCVRLDGPAEARIAQASRRRGIDEGAARRDQEETDRARSAYMHTFYGQSQDSTHLYHVALDSTALSPGTCVEIVLQAAKDRLGMVANPDQ
jgi:cytidylate kinase